MEHPMTKPDVNIVTHDGKFYLEHVFNDTFRHWLRFEKSTLLYILMSVSVPELPPPPITESAIHHGTPGILIFPNAEGMVTCGFSFEDSAVLKNCVRFTVEIGSTLNFTYGILVAVIRYGSFGITLQKTDTDRLLEQLSQL